MNRRNVLLGLGTAAAGSGIVFGSGAFTQVQAERDLTIGISEDSNALLELNPNSNLASIFQASDTGELVIDTRELSSGNEGFNVGSTVLIGETSTDLVNRNPQDATVVNTLTSTASGTGAAFQLINNFESTADSNDEIDIALNLEDLNAGDGTLTLIGTERDGSGGDQGTQIASDGGQTIFSSVASGNKIYFAIELETESTTSPDDISGNMVFRAGPDLAGGFPTDAEQASSPVVNVTTEETFGSLNKALGSVNQGDLIQVDPTHTENGGVSIDTPNVTIETAADTFSSRPTIQGEGKTDGEAINVNRPGVTLNGLDVTFDDNTSQPDNSERYAIRAGNNLINNVSDGADIDFTIKNCSVGGFSTSDISSNSGAVRASGITIDTANSSGNTSSSVSGVEITNCYINDIKCTGTVDNSDSRSKGISFNGEVNDSSITNCTIKNIGVENTSAQNASTGTADSEPAEGTTKPRGIALTEGNNPGTIHTNLRIARNEISGIEGTYGQPAIFVGGANDDLGSNHTVEFNNISQPIDNLNYNGADNQKLNLRANFYDASVNAEAANPDPPVRPPDSDEDGGVLIERGTGGNAYNVLDSRENKLDAGSSLTTLNR